MATKINIPDIADVSEKYRSLVARRDELHADARALRDEQREALKAIADRAEEKKKRVVSIVSKLSKPKQHRDPNVIGEEIQDITDAIGLIEVQMGACAMEASIKIREIIEPDHARAVTRIADAMLALRDAFSDYKAIADELNAKGVAWTALRPMHPNFIGDPDNRFGPIALWLKEAAQYGFIKNSSIPEALRDEA